MNTLVVLSISIFVIGLWIGVGAPGWPIKPEGGRKHIHKRSINPIAWGRTPGRERQRPRRTDERKIRLR